MAITIDQFLRDLTERELLSTEEAHTVRKELTASKSKPDEKAPGSGEHPTAVLNSAPLVLCDCLIQDKLPDEEHHLVFNAQRLRDDSAVTIHVLVPGNGADTTSASSRLNGTSFAGEAPSRPKGITDVGRHGEMMFVCCESLEAETLEQVVLQNGVLPLELATETLLQTARTLKRLDEQGVSLQKATPQTLLLDEDGRVHLTGSSPDQFLKVRSARHQDEDPPRNPLFESLGQLYGFLVSGRAVESSELSDIGALLPDSAADSQVTQAVKRVYARLIGERSVSIYSGWDELIQDLERLLNAQTLPAPVEPPRTEIPTKVVAAASETTSSKRPALPPVKASGQTGRWVLIVLALLAAVCVAAFVMLGN